MASGYQANIYVKVKGFQDLTRIQKKLDGTSYKIDEINKKAAQLGASTRSLSRFTQQLSQAQTALSKVAIGSPQERNAVSNYVTALNNSNVARKHQIGLIEQEINSRRKNLIEIEKEVRKNIAISKSGRSGTGFTSFDRSINNQEAKAIDKSIRRHQRKRKIIKETNVERRKALILLNREEETERKIQAILKRKTSGKSSRLGRDNKSAMTSGLISGAFPLLFGQGPLGGAAGFAGGFAGTKIAGQMGGFAGGLVATAALQTITQTISSISKLGQALGSFSTDVESITQSLGIQNTAQGANLKLIRELKGEQAAYNEAMRLMRVEIGDKGVAALKKFGETSNSIGRELAILGTKLQSATATLLNFIVKILGYESSIKKGSNTRLIKGMTSEAAIDLQERRKNLKSVGSGMRNQGGRRQRLISNATKALEADEQRLAIQERTRIAVENTALASVQRFEELKKEELVQTRINDLVEGGMNKGLAKTIAQIETVYEKDLAILKAKKAQLEKAEGVNVKGSEAAQQLAAMTVEIENFKENAAEAVETVKRIDTASNGVTEKWKEINQSIRNDITEGVKGLIKGTATWADMLNNIADKFLDMALNQAFYGNIMGKMGEGSGGLFGAILGMFGGKKAAGGPVKGGKSYVVGEKGPEMFVPSSSGKIVPNHQLGGGGATNVTVNVDASGTEVQGDDAQAKQLGTMLSAAVQAELVKQKRPGGLLAGV